MCVVLCCVCLVVVSGGGVGADGVEDDFFPDVVEVCFTHYRAIFVWCLYR